MAASLILIWILLISLFKIDDIFPTSSGMSQVGDLVSSWFCYLELYEDICGSRITSSLLIVTWMLPANILLSPVTWRRPILHLMILNGLPFKDSLIF